MRFGLACIIMLGCRELYAAVGSVYKSSESAVSKGIEAPIGIQWMRTPHKHSSYIHQLHIQTIKGGVCTNLGMAGVGWD